MNRRTFALGLLTAILGAGSAGWVAGASAGAEGRADDWTRFRGPNGSGVSDAAFNAPITEADFAWKVALPGTGHSSPVVRGDRVYLTAGDPATAARIVLCLDTKDGHTVWKREFPSATFRAHNDNSYASSTPAVDDAGVYVAWSTPESLTLTALDHDGKDRWVQDLGPHVSQHGGAGASPVVVGDLVILPNDNEGPVSTVAAFDHTTGAPRWKLDRRAGNKTAQSTPCLFAPKDGPPQLILSSKSGGVTGVDPKTGKVLWEATGACPGRPIGSPVVTDELVIATSGDGNTQRDLAAVRPSGAGPAAVAYKLSKLPPYVPTPVVKGGLMFLWGDNGQITCVKAATGQTVWSDKVNGQFYGSPVCAGDTLWCMSRKGKLVGVAAADTFKLVGETDLGEPSHATPAVAGGRMYLRTVSHLICVGPKAAK